MRKAIVRAAWTLAVFASGVLLGRLPDAVGASVQEPADKVFELRVYTTPPGKLPDLLARFRDHTTRIFEKHGMTNVGYWVPEDAPQSENTLVYILSHESREAADRSWQAFGEDPEWRRVSEESQRDGRIVSGVERTFMSATDFSPID